ncbi:MAG: ChuX/HutX family heme-like substrate-binding protein [Steroidobacteraceae bacterium]
MHRTFAGTLLATWGLALAAPALADPFCATPEEAKQVADFYAEHPATMPPVAAARLKLPEATVVSALGADVAASAPGADFAAIWAKLGEMSQLTFLIMKGPDVFEIASAAGKGTPSKTSRYFNIAYTQPLRGHLRPDLYASVYAVTLGSKDKDQVAPRGILAYDASGASVFGAFLGGDGPKPTAADLVKFEELMALVRSKTPVCPRR